MLKDRPVNFGGQISEAGLNAKLAGEIGCLANWTSYQIRKNAGPCTGDGSLVVTIRFCNSAREGLKTKIMLRKKHVETHMSPDVRGE